MTLRPVCVDASATLRHDKEVFYTVGNGQGSKPCRRYAADIIIEVLKTILKIRHIFVPSIYFHSMFKISDSVKVKPGVKDPDNEIFDLGGWQGRISAIEQSEDEEPIVTIVWDSITLREMPKVFIEKSLREGYDFEEMNLLESELELAPARDKAEDSHEVAASLEDAFRWADLGEQGKRIQAVEDSCEDDFHLMHHWFEHLENNIELPIKAKYTGDSTQNLRQGAEILINGFVDADDHYGVIGSAKYQKQWIQVPLCDVEVLESSKKTEALEDYIVWFANQ
jgi:Calcium binding